MTNANLPLALTLRYQHSHGAFAPYFAGLSQGKAMATRCGRCGRTWCPPLFRCLFDGGEVSWLELPGAGRVLSLTLTTIKLPLSPAPASYLFGLVRLDDADNAMFARLDLPEGNRRVDARVQLIRAPGDWPHPAQAAVFVPLAH